MLAIGPHRMFNLLLVKKQKKPYIYQKNKTTYKLKYICGFMNYFAYFSAEYIYLPTNFSP